MYTGQIVCLVIYGWVAIFVIGIGVMQIRSKHPVGFYTGENPPKDQEITDVKCWNLKHGRMWIIYGLVIIVSYGISCFLKNDVYRVALMGGGVILPLPILIGYHHYLIKCYHKL